mgnify:FL=1
MIQYKINSLILKDSFKSHGMIKDDLLELINKSNDKSWLKKDSYFNDDLAKTDWPLADDWERDWTKRYRGLFLDKFKEFANTLGYKNIQLSKLWYQQYGLKQTHGWHVHARNYTGVYYLELPKDSPHTEFIYPNNLNKGFTIEVKEGDMVFFPCNFMHRSKPSLSKKTKTIISWNLDFEDILDKHIGEKESIATL